jgi:hypothetical protein
MKSRALPAVFALFRAFSRVKIFLQNIHVLEIIFPKKNKTRGTRYRTTGKTGRKDPYAAPFIPTRKNQRCLFPHLALFLYLCR